VNINHPRHQSSTGDDCTASYCFDVTTGAGPLDVGVSWFWDGDNYGSPPHWPCSNDTFAPPGFTCDEAIKPVATVPICIPGVFLIPDYQEGSGCEKKTVDYTMSLFNNTGAPTNFTMTYSATLNTVGPATVYADQGDIVDFSVSVDIPCSDDFDDALVTASGNDYTSAAAILHTFFSPVVDWNAENADLSEMPSDIWGMGYAQTEDQLWIVAGVQSDTISAVTYYFDLGTGTWNADGNLSSGAVFRTSAVVLDNVLYKLGGSTVSFNYTGLSDKHVPPWTAIATEPNNGRMDNVIASYEGFVWSITGYGLDSNVRKYDPVSDTWMEVGTPPPFGINYARSGCQIGDKVYLYGDTSTLGFTGLWSYDMATTTWAQEIPSGIPPIQNAIWAPAWVADAETGKCYMTGGATTSFPVTGILKSTYVYDALNNSWLDPLPEFSTARDFHAAFLYKRPTDNHKMLCVAGGNKNNVGLSRTQCFDLAGCTRCLPPNIEVSPLSLHVIQQPDSITTTPISMCNTGESLLNWVIKEILPSNVSFGLPTDDYAPSSLSSRAVINIESKPSEQVHPDSVLNNIFNNIIRYIGSDDYHSVFDAIPSDTFIDIPWLSENPITGTIISGTCSLVNVNFYSTELAPDDYYGGLQLDSNDPEDPIIGVPVTLTVIIMPDIVVTPPSLEMNLLPDETGTFPFTIFNNGTDDLYWSLTDDAPWLSEDPTSGSILPADSREVQVSFDATGLVKGVYYTDIFINNSDPEEPIITLPVTLSVGMPDIEISPSSLEMILIPNATGMHAFTIYNYGTDDLEWSLNDDVTWLSEDLTSSNILPGGSMQVSVVFDATSLVLGVYNTNIIITSNDPNEPSISLPVTLSVKNNYQFYLPITQN
jgi:hypothetical protein